MDAQPSVVRQEQGSLERKSNVKTNAPKKLKRKKRVLCRKVNKKIPENIGKRGLEGARLQSDGLLVFVSKYTEIIKRLSISLKNKVLEPYNRKYITKENDELTCTRLTGGGYIFLLVCRAQDNNKGSLLRLQDKQVRVELGYHLIGLKKHYENEIKKIHAQNIMSQNMEVQKDGNIETGQLKPLTKQEERGFLIGLRMAKKTNLNRKKFMKGISDTTPDPGRIEMELSLNNSGSDSDTLVQLPPKNSNNSNSRPVDGQLRKISLSTLTDPKLNGNNNSNSFGSIFSALKNSGPLLPFSQSQGLNPIQSITFTPFISSAVKPLMSATSEPLAGSSNNSNNCVSETRPAQPTVASLARLHADAFAKVELAFNVQWTLSTTLSTNRPTIPRKEF
jgi:hypothetical protein